MRILVSISADRPKKLSRKAFDALKPAQQKAYLKAYPNSSYASPTKAKQSSKHSSKELEVLTLRLKRARETVKIIKKDLVAAQSKPKKNKGEIEHLNTALEYYSGILKKTQDEIKNPGSTSKKTKPAPKVEKAAVKKEKKPGKSELDKLKAELKQAKDALDSDKKALKQFLIDARADLADLKVELKEADEDEREEIEEEIEDLEDQIKYSKYHRRVQASKEEVENLEIEIEEYGS